MTVNGHSTGWHWYTFVTKMNEGTEIIAKFVPIKRCCPSTATKTGLICLKADVQFMKERRGKAEARN